MKRPRLRRVARRRQTTQRREIARFAFAIDHWLEVRIIEDIFGKPFERTARVREMRSNVVAPDEAAAVAKIRRALPVPDGMTFGHLIDSMTEDLR